MVVFCSKTPWSVLPPKGMSFHVFHFSPTWSCFSPGTNTAGHKEYPDVSAFKIIKYLVVKLEEGRVMWFDHQKNGQNRKGL